MSGEPVYRTTSNTVKRGNAFDRLILRVLRIKTDKEVVTDECVAGSAPPSRMDSSKRPIEIWVFGAAVCPIFD